MKSKATFISIMLLVLTICSLIECPTNASASVDNEALNEYVSYNSTERLEAEGENYRKDFYAVENNQEVLVSSQYWDSGKVYVEGNDGMTFSYGNNLFFLRYQNNGEVKYEAILIWPEGINKYILLDPLFIPEEETLIEAASDKPFIVVTEIAAKKYVENELKGYVGDEIEYEEGMRIRYRYTFDKDTKELLEIDATLFYPDDSTRSLGILKYSYGVVFSDPLKSEDNKDFIAAVEDPAQNRTIKVTYGPGTGKEQTVEYTIPTECRFYIFTDDFVSEVYTDRDCTELYIGSDGTSSDLELFVPVD